MAWSPLMAQTAPTKHIMFCLMGNLTKEIPHVQITQVWSVLIGGVATSVRSDGMGWISGPHLPGVWKGISIFRNGLKFMLVGARGKGGS